MLKIKALLGCDALPMATITIRNLKDELKTRLRVRAAHHGRSMEDEARDILRVALSSESHTSRDLIESIRRRFTAVGGIELDLPPREPIREPPDVGQ
jgi:plasmid stability protein